MKKVVLSIACAMSIAVAAVAQQKAPPPPPPPPPQPPAVKVVKHNPPAEVDGEEAYKAFLKRNKSVEQLRWKNEHTVVLKMKDKTSSTYNLSDDKVKKSFVQEFGEAPLPPPLPPPPPAPPVNIEE